MSYKDHMKLALQCAERAFQIGEVPIGAVIANADGDVIAFSTTVSDIALKSDIEMIPNALDKIDEVRGVTFTRHNGQKSAGIIAQELEKVLPEAVREKELKLVDGKKYKTVEYDAIHGLLINCIKELKQEIKELKDGSTK